jgi:hypothetical protein
MERVDYSSNSTCSICCTLSCRTCRKLWIFGDLLQSLQLFGQLKRTPLAQIKQVKFSPFHIYVCGDHPQHCDFVHLTPAACIGVRRGRQTRVQYICLTDNKLDEIIYRYIDLVICQILMGVKFSGTTSLLLHNMTCTSSRLQMLFFLVNDCRKVYA